MKDVNIGLIGFGTIGSGVYELLKKNSKIIKERTGLNLIIKKICDLQLDLLKKEIKDKELTDNWEEVVNDKNIDIIIELIGGIEPAKTIVLTSLKNGKSVVTANKKLLAEEGEEIFKTAGSSKSKLGFEASIAGGIPCLLALKSGLVSNNIKSIIGILNGTTNYILTRMEEQSLQFHEVLKDAQKKGFAEADPTFDIEGFDAGHKISLLAMLAYHKKVDFKKIPIDGITNISDMDINYAKEMGYTIKLLGIAKFKDDKLDIRVHPAMIPKKHLLASVRNEFNAVMFDGDMTGPVILYGKGAGSYPTASAIVSDVVQIVEKNGLEESPIIVNGEAEYLDPANSLSRYYLRIHTEDAPGILSEISGVLGEHNISIASVIQKEVNTKYVPVVIMTHTASEDKIQEAIRIIENLKFIDGKIIMIRVEDSIFSGDNDE